MPAQKQDGASRRNKWEAFQYEGSSLLSQGRMRLKVQLLDAMQWGKSARDLNSRSYSCPGIASLSIVSCQEILGERITTQGNCCEKVPQREELIRGLEKQRTGVIYWVPKTCSRERVGNKTSCCELESPEFVLDNEVVEVSVHFGIRNVVSLCKRIRKKPDGVKHFFCSLYSFSSLIKTELMS